jgi:hypothetical protein
LDDGPLQHLRAAAAKALQFGSSNLYYFVRLAKNAKVNVFFKTSPIKISHWDFPRVIPHHTRFLDSTIRT